MLKLLYEEEIKDSENIDNEQPVEEKPVEADELNFDIPEAQPVDDTQAKIAIQTRKENIEGLIRAAWDFISALDSFSVVTLAQDLDAAPIEKLDEIKSIVETVMDDVTIDIGMLSKISQLFDEHSSDLMAQGADKAEEVLQGSEAPAEEAEEEVEEEQPEEELDFELEDDEEESEEEEESDEEEDEEKSEDTEKETEEEK